MARLRLLASKHAWLKMHLTGWQKHRFEKLVQWLMAPSPSIAWYHQAGKRLAAMRKQVQPLSLRRRHSEAGDRDVLVPRPVIRMFIAKRGVQQVLALGSRIGERRRWLG